MLAFEGVGPDEVTVDFLVDLMDLSEKHGLDVDGIGINWRESCGEDPER